MANLRICDGQSEHVVPASLALVEEIFASEASIADGTEIGLADDVRWLVAVAVCTPGDVEAFLLSGELGAAGSVSGRVSRQVALQHFRDFLLESDV